VIHEGGGLGGRTEPRYALSLVAQTGEQATQLGPELIDALCELLVGFKGV
jgi:hypothetical protein